MSVLDCETALIKSREIFETIYRDYNKRAYVSPDPLQFLYNYGRAGDREVAGLIASSLAYGRVAQILKSVGKVLGVLGPSPASYLADVGRRELEEKLGGFVHRFTGAGEMVSFLCCIKAVRSRYGSLENLFFEKTFANSWDAAENFVAGFTACGGGVPMYLLPSPAKGSACKRLWLFLRWMGRRDEVDPGGWDRLTPDALRVPLDTHMFNICSTLGLCARKSADRRAAEEITAAFRIIRPEDPVRYDFALTRFGIRNDMTVPELFELWRGEGYNLNLRPAPQRRPQ